MYLVSALWPSAWSFVDCHSLQSKSSRVRDKNCSNLWALEDRIQKCGQLTLSWPNACTPPFFLHTPHMNTESPSTVPESPDLLQVPLAHPWNDHLPTMVYLSRAALHIPVIIFSGNSSPSTPSKNSKIPKPYNGPYCSKLTSFPPERVLHGYLTRMLSKKVKTSQKDSGLPDLGHGSSIQRHALLSPLIPTKPFSVL